MSDSVTPWTVARQAHLSVGFSRQEYWSGILLQGIFPIQGLNLRLLHWQVDSLPLCYSGSQCWEAKKLKKKWEGGITHLAEEAARLRPSFFW